MTRPRVPDAVLTAAHDRAKARAAHDWLEADRLRAEIEAAGWRIVDRGTDFALHPAAPPDIDDDTGTRRYGASSSVPSRLEEPAAGLATVVLVVTEHAADVERALTGLHTHVPGVQVVIVADDPSPDATEALGAVDPAAAEVVWTSARLGHAAALNAGIRRGSAPIVVVLDPSVEPIGDCIGPLVAALDDPTVAVTGSWGLTSLDLRQFEDAPPGDVDAIEGYCQAFRRTAYVERGPLDERFRFYRNLDIWWSLVLRDEGPGSPPGRAVSLADLPLVRHAHRGWASLPDEERDRQSRRNFYRIIDRFGGRRDLLIRPG